MTLTNFPGGITSMGVPVNNSRAFGKTYFVDSTNGQDGNTGLDVDHALKTLTRAFVLISNYDTIILSAGNFTGNYTTPVNATASFVRVIGFPIGSYGLSTWMGATTASSPIIDVRARGWSFENIEFNCPTDAAAIRLTKSVDGSTHRCDFTTIRHNIFTTGKYGITVNGGGTHVHVHHNKFDQLTSSGAFAIKVVDTSNQIPAFWLVEDNIFATSLNHIGPGNATYGWNESIFRRNVHQSDSGVDATTICDMRASGGTGNRFLDNYLDVVTAGWNTETSVRGNAKDFGAGNHMSDGDQSTAMNVS